ncbi:MAG: hypothetical protein ACE5HQ_03590 [Gemmatimonadota bacterium]
MNSTGSVGRTTLLATGAIVAMGIFLFWLYRASHSLESNSFVAADTVAAEEIISVQPSDLVSDPGALVGKRGSLGSVPVANWLGRGAFSLRLDDANDFPVLLSPDLIQKNVQVYGGDVVSVWGRFYTLNDSIRAEWVRQGAVDSTSVANLPETVSFLLADSLNVM